ALWGRAGERCWARATGLPVGFPGATGDLAGDGDLDVEAKRCGIPLQEQKLRVAAMTRARNLVCVVFMDPFPRIFVGWPSQAVRFSGRAGKPILLCGRDWSPILRSERTTISAV